MTTPGRATPVGYVLTAVAIGVLVFLAGAVAGAGHNAPVATSPEDMFVAVMRDRGIFATSSREEIVSLGKMECDGLSSLTPRQEIAVVFGAGGVTDGQAAVFVNGAIFTYCPSYAHTN